MHLPGDLLDQLSLATAFDREAFVRAHNESAAPTSIRLNPTKMPPLDASLQPVGWSRFGYYLPQRPSFTFDPLFHAGCYYVQEASSMLLEQAFTQLMPQDKPLRALDLCAAPGGKSTHLYSLLPKDSFLIANEVIRSRAMVLRDNLIRWGARQAMVTNNDPEQFRTLENFFDWITVDAPCSGSGLFRKDPSAIEQWSLPAVQHCALRQQRILSAAWQALRPGGILFYATCSFSVEENEAMANWLIAEKNAEPVSIQLQKEWNIVATEPGYRCWPDRVQGEGFYCCCLRKPVEAAAKEPRNLASIFRALGKQEQSVIAPWIVQRDDFYFQLQQTVYAWPRHCVHDWQLCSSVLNVLYAGVRVGQLMRDKLVPDHALSQCDLLSDSIPAVSLALSEAIAFLQRRSLSITNESKGWCVVTYKQFVLGWINALPNRINNYYPKELRIIKDSLDGGE